MGTGLAWWRAGVSVSCGAAGFRWLADVIEVEVVAGVAGEQVDDLVGAGQAVGDRGGDGVGFGPDDLVAQYPAALGECQGEAFGTEQQAFLRCAFALVGAVAVAEVEPQCAGGNQNTGHFVGDGEQIVHPTVDGVLEAELVLVLVVAQSEVRWAGDDAVDAAGVEFTQPA